MRPGQRELVETLLPRLELDPLAGDVFDPGSAFGSGEEDIWLEIGSGRKYGTDGWVTMNVELECDLHADLRDGIPFPNSTVSRIYSSHLFEHLTYPDGQRLMMEARRVLTEGGEFSICVPNARLYIDAYTSGKKLTSPFLG